MYDLAFLQALFNFKHSQCVFHPLGKYLDSLFCKLLETNSKHWHISSGFELTWGAGGSVVGSKQHRRNKKQKHFFKLQENKQTKCKTSTNIPRKLFFIMEFDFLPRQVFSFAVYNPNSYSIVLEYRSLEKKTNWLVCFYHPKWLRTDHSMQDLRTLLQ